MSQSFTNSDKLTLLSQPGVFYYRDKGSVGEWNKALFANGATYNKAVETSEIVFDDVGTVQEEVSNETVEISVATGRVLDLDFIEAISGGMYEITNTPGDAHTGEEYVVSSGSWNFDKFILLPGQNATGAKQTIVSVTGSVDGLLAVAVDYDQVKLAEIGWGIMVKDSTEVTTESQDLTIVYTYTPASLKKLSTGGRKIINPLEIKFETFDNNDKLVTYEFYNCYPAGNFGHGFSPENSSEAITADLTFTAKKDSSRAAGDQLYSVKKEL